jgi:hypothetical protein
MWLGLPHFGAVEEASEQRQGKADRALRWEGERRKGDPSEALAVLGGVDPEEEGIVGIGLGRQPPQAPMSGELGGASRPLLDARESLRGERPAPPLIGERKTVGR